MIKVLIVEDEPPIARALGRLIMDANPSFSIVGYAKNGKEGLQMYQDQKPAVVFTDIKMPVMDGLQLFEAIHDLGDMPKMVILSGFQEFEYAKKALNLRVNDYLLKPVSRPQLIEVLDKIKEQLDKESYQEKNDFLSSNFQGLLPDVSEIKEGSCKVAVVCAGTLPVASDKGAFPGSFAWDNLNLASYPKAQSNELWDFVGLTSVERIFILESVEGLGYFEHLYKWMSRQSKIPLTMIVHTNGIDISSIGLMQRLLRNTLYERLIFGEANYFIMEAEHLTSSDISDGLLKELRYEFLKKDRSYIRNSIHQFFESCNSIGVTQKRMLKYMEWIVSFYCEIVLGRQLIDYDFDLRAIISNSYHYDILEQELESIFNEMDSQKGMDKETDVMEQVKIYLEEHYLEQLTNETLARHFGFATSYLCRIYKNKYKISPGNYITKLKIEEAKELMLRYPTIMIKEVADRVGYKDQYYFSKVFRRETGYWPTHFLKKDTE